MPEYTSSDQRPDAPPEGSLDMAEYGYEHPEKGFRFFIGWDSKFKKALIAAAMGDDEKRRDLALKILEDRDWMSFLEKAQNARRKVRKDPRTGQKASATQQRRAFGLTEGELFLLTNPPTDESWVCTNCDIEGMPTYNNGRHERCWFCNATKPDAPELVRDAFQAALRQFASINWAEVEATIEAATKGTYYTEAAMLARKLVGLRKRHGAALALIEAEAK